MSKKILITGANGFIGSRLVASLEKDNKDNISILDRKKTPLDDIKGLTDIVNDKDVIVHLAGLTRGSMLDLTQANVDGTSSILKAVAKIEGKKPLVIFSSTFGVYEPSTVITEQSVVGPRGDYGKSKLLAEEILENYSKKFDIPVLVLRLSNVYGFGMPPFSHSVVATFIQLVNEGQAINLDGDGFQKRDFVYIDDVVIAFKKATSLDLTSGKFEVVNVCSAQPVSVKELAELIGEILHKNVKINYLPENKNDSWAALNYDRARDLLNWKPEVSLKDGIVSTV